MIGGGGNEVDADVNDESVSSRFAVEATSRQSGPGPPQNSADAGVAVPQDPSDSFVSSAPRVSPSTEASAATTAVSLNALFLDSERTLRSMCGQWVDQHRSQYLLKFNKRGPSLDVRTTRPNGQIVETNALIHIWKRPGESYIIWGCPGRTQFTLGKYQPDYLVWTLHKTEMFKWKRSETKICSNEAAWSSTAWSSTAWSSPTSFKEANRGQLTSWWHP